jgi:quinol monooxygenase YgiN
MSIRYVGTSIAKAGQSTVLKTLLEQKVMPAVKASAGCLSCQLLQDSKDAHKFIIIEEWESLEALQASIKNISPDEIKQFMELVAESPSGSHYHSVAVL